MIVVVDYGSFESESSLAVSSANIDDIPQEPTFVYHRSFRLILMVVQRLEEGYHTSRSIPS